jgi:hypothetical protein
LSLATQCSFKVTINDVTAPVVSPSPPSDIVQDTDLGACDAVVTSFGISATDDCSTVTTTCTPAESTTFGIGLTTVNCDVKDDSNNGNNVFAIDWSFVSVVHTFVVVR